MEQDTKSRPWFKVACIVLVLLCVVCVVVDLASRADMERVLQGQRTQIQMRLHEIEATCAEIRKMVGGER